LADRREWGLKESAYKSQTARKEDGGEGKNDGDGNQYLDDVDHNIIFRIAQQNVACNICIFSPYDE